MGLKELRLPKGADSRSSQAWRKLSSTAGPGSVPKGMIIGLEVYDPRLRCALPPTPIPSIDSIILSFPPKLDKSTHDVNSSSLLQPTSEIAQALPFWDQAARLKIRTPRFKKSELDARRSNVCPLPLTVSPHPETLHSSSFPALPSPPSSKTTASPSSSPNAPSRLLSTLPPALARTRTPRITPTKSPAGLSRSPPAGARRSGPRSSSPKRALAACENVRSRSSKPERRGFRRTTLGHQRSTSTRRGGRQRTDPITTVVRPPNDPTSSS